MADTTHNSPVAMTEAKPTSAIQINMGEQLTPANSIRISLIKPSTMESTVGPTDAHHFDQIIQIHCQKTRIQDIKSHISSTWKGKPKTDGIRLIARGRILNDTELVGQALDKLVHNYITHSFDCESSSSSRDQPE
jgi:hypothetical protein